VIAGVKLGEEGGGRGGGEGGGGKRNGDLLIEFRTFAVASLPPAGVPSLRCLRASGERGKKGGGERRKKEKRKREKRDGTPCGRQLKAQARELDEQIARSQAAPLISVTSALPQRRNKEKRKGKKGEKGGERKKGKKRCRQLLASDEDGSREDFPGAFGIRPFPVTATSS